MIFIMHADRQSILASALNLSEEDRLAIANSLFESVAPGGRNEFDTAWREEVQKRLGQIEHGDMSFVPGEETLRKLRGMIGDRAG